MMKRHIQTLAESYSPRLRRSFKVSVTTNAQRTLMQTRPSDAAVTKHDRGLAPAR